MDREDEPDLRSGRPSRSSLACFLGEEGMEAYASAVEREGVEKRSNARRLEYSSWGDTGSIAVDREATFVLLLLLKGCEGALIFERRRKNISLALDFLSACELGPGSERVDELKACIMFQGEVELLTLPLRFIFDEMLVG